jgi:hypothetical protein
MNLRHFLLLGSLACSPLASAQSVITWTTATDISVNDTDVVNDGRLIYAYNFGLTPQTVVLNGYTFQAASTATASNYAFTGDGTIHDGYDGFMTDLPSGMSGSYHQLLTSGRYVDAGDAVLTLQNLTVGQAYQIQLWMNDARTDSPILGRTALAHDGPEGSSVTLAFNQGALGGSLGEFALGQFVATTGSQQIFLDRVSGDAVQLNAFAVSAIPEPSTYAAAAGLLALGLAACRRSRPR